MSNITPKNLFYIGLLQAYDMASRQKSPEAAEVLKHLQAASVWFEEACEAEKSFYAENSFRDRIQRKAIERG